MRQNRSKKRRLSHDYKHLLRLYNSGADFVAFDTETTGLSAKVGRIIELGAVRFNKNGTLSFFHSLINPHTKLSSFIKGLTHIDDDMLLSAPDIKSVIPEFVKFCENSYFVAHNAGFDIKYLAEELERNNFPRLKNLAFDSLDFSRKVFPDLEHHNLQFLAAHFSVDVKNAHRADDDARVCMEILKICIKKYEQDRLKASLAKQAAKTIPGELLLDL